MKCFFYTTIKCLEGVLTSRENMVRSGLFYRVVVVGGGRFEGKIGAADKRLRRGERRGGEAGWRQLRSWECDDV